MRTDILKELLGSDNHLDSLRKLALEIYKEVARKNKGLLVGEGCMQVCQRELRKIKEFQEEAIRLGFALEGDEKDIYNKVIYELVVGRLRKGE
jgi:hypothetical protein